MNRRAVIYARVSSAGDRQSTERQLADLTAYASRAGLEIVRLFEEKESGAREDRPVLRECIDFLIAGNACNASGTGNADNADTLLLSEISRLGRSVKIVIDTLDALTKARINVYIQDINLNTLDADGNENPLAKVIITMLSLGAEMERKNIVNRLNSGRALAKSKGVKFGRKEGYRKSREQKADEYSKVIRLLRQGESIRNVAVLSGVSLSTVKRLKKEFSL